MFNAVGIIFLAMVIINLSLDIALNFFNIRHLKQKGGHLPAVFRDQIDQETYKKSINYNLDLGKFDILETVVSFLVVIYFVYLGGFERIDTMARIFSPNGYYLTALIFGLTVFFIKFLVSIPFDLYNTFIIEERYGFNKTTPGLYFSDLVKSVLLSALIGIPVYLGMIWFMAKSVNYWWIWCWCLIEAIQIILLVIYPIWIAPLFNKFYPIEDKVLKEKVLSLSKKPNFFSQGVFTMDGSKRSSHANAYFTGLGRKRRIVLFDTLIKQMNISQVLAVLAHEIGHYKLHHLKKIFILNSLTFLICFYLLNCLFRLDIFYRGFGFSHASNYAALVIFSLGISAISFLFAPFFSMIARRFEYQADKFAIKNIEDPRTMVEAITILTKENLMNLNPHPWYSFFHYSHPAPVERVQAIEKVIGSFEPPNSC